MARAAVEGVWVSFLMILMRNYRRTESLAPKFSGGRRHYKARPDISKVRQEWRAKRRDRNHYEDDAPAWSAPEGPAVALKGTVRTSEDADLHRRAALRWAHCPFRRRRAPSPSSRLLSPSMPVSAAAAHSFRWCYGSCLQVQGLCQGLPQARAQAQTHKALYAKDKRAERFIQTALHEWIVPTDVV